MSPAQFLAMWLVYTAVKRLPDEQVKAIVREVVA